MANEGGPAARGQNGAARPPAGRPAFDTSVAHQVLRFFGGLELVVPGLVELRHWRPAVASSRITPGWCGPGRKP